MINSVLGIGNRKDPKLLPSMIQIRIRNKMISMIWIWIQNIIGDQASWKTNAVIKTLFSTQSSISAQKYHLNVHSDFKCVNFTKISTARIRIRIQRDPRAGSESGSEINTFRSATLDKKQQFSHASHALYFVKLCCMPENILLSLEWVWPVKNEWQLPDPKWPDKSRIRIRNDLTSWIKIQNHH